MYHARVRHFVCVYVIICSVSALWSPNSFAAIAEDKLLLRDDDFDPDDLSFIKKLAAVGDSYSAGVGSGTLLKRPTFHAPFGGKYDHSYPYIINQDGRLGDPQSREFQFESCSGAVVEDVVENQIPQLDNDQDIILMSAGGNDADLLAILNQCIFQWFAPSKTASGFALMIAKLYDQEWAEAFDWWKNARGCEGQLKISQEIIESDSFAKSLDGMIAAAKRKLSPTGMIYYTGYAKFFSTDYGPECDKASWSVYALRVPIVWQERAHLTTARRRLMNDLVDLMNKHLEAAVQRAGPQVKFVGYDDVVGHFKGRYCENGVDEGSYESNNRDELMFYEMSTTDPFGWNPWRRSTGDHMNGTFGAQINVWARATDFLEEGAKFRHEHLMGEDVTESNAAMEGQILAAADEQVPNWIPDGYGRVFHPHLLLHYFIANAVFFHVTNRRREENGFRAIPWEGDSSGGTCTIRPDEEGRSVLTPKAIKPGEAVKNGAKLRILPVGDSITVGWGSERLGGHGNGYRGHLKDNLSGNKVVFAGTESSGTMVNGSYVKAAWSGKTIKYISDNVDPALEQRPNIILLHAGTNDMNSNSGTSTEGNDPRAAADRLGKLIDKMTEACPDATILVAKIIGTCIEDREARTGLFQELIPGVVKSRRDAGHHVIAADFSKFSMKDHMLDCVHPNNAGYNVMGDWWYSFIHQIPESWIKIPVGPDPGFENIDDNGGLDQNIPLPDWGANPIQVTSKETVAKAAELARGDDKGPAICRDKPHWRNAGKIAMGVESMGDWQYKSNWVDAGILARGVGLDEKYVRLHDMNGDGKADYVWIDPKTGELRCWINNLPNSWSSAGNNDSVIATGVSSGDTIFLADLNGDKMDDYLVLNSDDGSVRVWWNYGPADSWDNGWKFVRGEEIASGVRHANLETLRFADMNGDGRDDYLYIGEGGSLKLYLNTGPPGGREVLWRDMGGIATGDVNRISELVLADMNGDGRDDYLIWDSDGGLTGHLNQPTRREGVPFWIDQGPAKAVATGVKKNFNTIRLADMDGDGKDDYVHVGANGALSVWYNRGSTSDYMTIDNLRFADIDGDGADDYVLLDPESGAPTVYLNAGIHSSGLLGWLWREANGGDPIASGAAPASQVVFGDINGDGLADYLDIDPKTGRINAYLNLGENIDPNDGPRWGFKSIGTIASGLGPGKRVRIADIDGDGRDDYILLKDNGGATIYRNTWTPGKDHDNFAPMPDAYTSGVGQSPDEIDFVDIDGDGKADYVWTRKLDGKAWVWYNSYPNTPMWRDGGEIASGVGASGSNVRYAKLQNTGRADYIVVDPATGALGAWLSSCQSPERPEKKYKVSIASGRKFASADTLVGDPVWIVKAQPTDGSRIDFCEHDGVQENTNTLLRQRYPTAIWKINKLHGHNCYFVGDVYRIGRLVCDGVTGIRCYQEEGSGVGRTCDDGLLSYSRLLECEW
nr:hypothetical protein [Paramyrothecium sp.]